MIDFLIVGQGLAGSILAWRLIQQGYSIKIIDAVNFENTYIPISNDAHPFQSASYVSTGLVNPITGRRFVKSWLIDDLLPIAEKTYAEIEKTVEQKLYQSIPIFRTFPDQRAANDWELRKNDEDYKAYIDETNYKLNTDLFNSSTDGMTVKASKRLKVRQTVMALRNFFEVNNCFINARVDYSQLKFEANHIELLLELDNGKTETLNCNKLICCEGAKAKDNPFFKQLPFTSCVGQILIIKADTLDIDRVLKLGLFIIPIGENLFQIGTTWDWDIDEPFLSEKAKEKMLNHLRKTLKVDFELIEHQAAVRPTIKDRRPVMGEHPTQRNTYIFNAFGAKGVSLIPYFTEHFIGYLKNEIELMKDVSINRFKNYIVQ